MAGAPKEYLSLPNAGGSFNYANIAYFVAGGSNYAAAPGGATTRYSKLRLDPRTLRVDRTDRTFATSQGYVYYGYSRVSAVDFASASGCSGAIDGTGNVNLVGTPFRVAPGQFSAGGWAAGGAATYSAGDQVVGLVGGGFCGGVSPATPYLQLVYTGPTDTTPPSITAASSPAANAGGWNNADVTVSFACADDAAGFGIAACSGPSTLTQEGAGQAVGGTAVDNAGNQASATRPPTPTAGPTPTWSSPSRAATRSRASRAARRR
jgi:hypothetical protein